MLTALEHALDIFRHDLAHVVDFLLRRPQRILLARIRPALLQHQLLQRGVEARAPVRGQRGKVRVRGIERGEEFLLEVGEEAKGDALPELARRDDEESQAAGGGLRGGEIGGRLDQAVREVCVLVDGAVRGGRVGQGGQDDGDERGGIGGGRGGVFG
jgi:hypothetical protein